MLETVGDIVGAVPLDDTCVGALERKLRPEMMQINEGRQMILIRKLSEGSLYFMVRLIRMTH